MDAMDNQLDATSLLSVGGMAGLSVLDGGSCKQSRVARRLKVTKVVSGCHSNVYSRCASVLVLMKIDERAVVEPVWDVRVLSPNRACHEIESMALSRLDYFHFNRRTSIACNYTTCSYTYKPSSIPREHCG